MKRCLAVLVLVGATLGGCSNPWRLSVPATSQGMTPTPPDGHASIMLLWPSSEARGYSVNVVAGDRHQVQAQLDAGEWTVVDVPAGEVELYFAPGHRTSSRIPRPLPELVTGEVGAGRVYMVRFAPESHELEVLQTGSSHWAHVAEWLRALRRVECNVPLATRYSNERGAALHAAHTAARERFLSLNSRSRAARTLRVDYAPVASGGAVATVHYRAGGAVRGTVVEYLPGREIVVQSGGAPPVRIPASAIERVDFD